MKKRRKLLDRKRVWLQKIIHLFIPFYLLCLIGSHLTSATSASLPPLLIHQQLQEV